MQILPIISPYVFSIYCNINWYDRTLVIANEQPQVNANHLSPSLAPFAPNRLGPNNPCPCTVLHISIYDNDNIYIAISGVWNDRSQVLS